MRLKTRKGKLHDDIKNELKSNEPSIDNILKCVDEYEKSNLETIEKLKKRKIITTKKINGGLRQTIQIHGPITMALIGSASKRIYGSLLSNEKPKENLFKKIFNWILK